MSNKIFQGIYRDPKTNKIIVRIFTLDYDCDNSDICKFTKRISEEFNIHVTITDLLNKYFPRDVENPIVAYINIDKILELTANGDEIDMGIFDAVAEEFAYNDDYQEYINLRFKYMATSGTIDKEVLMKAYNYIADKAVSLLNYHLEMVSKNWEAWKANGFKPSEE